MQVCVAMTLDEAAAYEQQATEAEVLSEKIKSIAKQDFQKRQNLQAV